MNPCIILIFFFGVGLELENTYITAKLSFHLVAPITFYIGEEKPISWPEGLISITETV